MSMNLQDVASSAGARDLFVLQRISGDRFFNVAGVGRGDGWAGNISIEATGEPWLSSVILDGVAMKRSGVPFRAFGPYWATEIAGILSGNVVVVFSGEGVTEMATDELSKIAGEIESSACEVSIEKQEADELELQQVIETVNAISATTSDDAAMEVAGTAARALSCEFGALLLFKPAMRIFIADEGWMPPATEEEIMAAIYPLRGLVSDGPFVEQDLSTSVHAHPPLSYGDGLVTRCTVPVGPFGSIGLLVVAHAGTAPRGFTSLCRRVAAAIGENAAGILAA